MIIQPEDRDFASSVHNTTNDTANLANDSGSVQLIKADSGSTIKGVIQGRDIIGNLIVTGDHNQFFIGGYERLRDAYITPGPVFERVGLEHFVGREWLLAEIDTFLRDHDRGYFVLEAEAGLGKTTFLAWLVRERGYIHHFTELAPGSNNIERGLKNLTAQLVLAYQLSVYEAEGILPNPAARPDFLYKLLSQAADQCQNKEKIVLVIDALDEVSSFSNQNVLGLPKVLPPGIFVIVSQRPVPVNLQVDTARTPRHIFRLSAENDGNRADMRHFLERAATWPGIAQALRDHVYTSEQFVTKLLKKCEGIWIYLHFVIHEIERGERVPLNLDTLPNGMTQYYIHYWQRWRDENEDKWYELYLPLLTTLTAAQETITIDKLVEWANVKIQTYKLQRLLNEQWRPFVVPVKQQGNTHYRLYHATLREFFDGQVQRDKLSTAEEVFVDELAVATRQAHSHITDHYLAIWGGFEGNLPKLQQSVTTDPDSNYGLRYVPTHLLKSKQKSMLYQLVRNPSWATAKSLTDPKAIWYLDDLALAFQAAVEDDFNFIIEAMGYELRRGLILKQISTPELEGVIFLAELGEFEWALALTKLRSLRDQVKILQKISQSLAGKDPNRALLTLERLANVADDAGNLLDQCKLRCLAAQEIVRFELSPSRARALAEEAKKMASGLPATELHSYQVEWLLPTIALTGDLEEVLDAAKRLPPTDQCGILRLIAQKLPKDHPQKVSFTQRALDLAETIEVESQGLEQQLYCLITLAKSQTEVERQQAIEEIIKNLDKLHDSTAIQVHGVQKLAELDPGRAKLLMEQERWPEAFDAWSEVVSQMAKVNVDSALNLLNERLENWAVYPLVLVEIIEQILLKDNDIDRAKKIIQENIERLKINLDSAYLALARAYLARGNQEGQREAEKIFYQPLFFVSEKHNPHTLAEMHLAMFRNAMSFVSPDIASDWFEKFPNCRNCGLNNEREKARQVLIQLAAYHDRYDLIKKYAYSEEHHGLVATILARKGNITEAQEYITQHHLRESEKYVIGASAYIAEVQARHNPSALDAFVGHYEANPPHHFCQAMLELPYILDSLAQVDPRPPVPIDEIIDRMWNSIINWECSRGGENVSQKTLGRRCECLYSREKVLGQLVGTMARINEGRAQEMLEVLPNSPAKVFALTNIAQLGKIDEALLLTTRVTILSTFQDPHDRAEAFYKLAAALPKEMITNAEELIVEAEPWLNERPIYQQTEFGPVRHGISADALKQLKGQALASLIQHPSDWEQIDEVLLVAGNLGWFNNKQAVFLALVQQAEKWSANAKIDLLRYVLKAVSNRELTDIQAVIAASVPIMHSLGGDLKELLTHIDWAYS